MAQKVLIIDDEDRFRELLGRIIGLEGFEIFQAQNVKEGFSVLEQESISVVVTDVKLPDGNGLQVLEDVKNEYPLIEVIVITAFGTIRDGVDAMKKGAFDYITKGDEDDHIHVIVEHAVEKARLQSKLHRLEQRIENQYSFENIIGESEAIEETKELAKKVAPSDMSVLLQGETGTGKELFAQAIHQGSQRKDKPFIALNCSAFPNDLLESELFGYKKGAFTGAGESKKGFLEEADSGTLFLDEIGEMDISLQAKLLRFLENKTFTKLGDTKERSVDIRIIAATNKNLKKQAEKEHFRDDLFYRLAGFTITIPTLTERKSDIPLLADFFLKRINNNIQHIADEVIEQLKTYPWKGNIRELKNIIERMAILAEDNTITSDLLPPEFNQSNSSMRSSSSNSLQKVEQLHIKKVLNIVDGNKNKAAEILGIGTSTLYRKIKEYKI
jgi:DNA-binding NtrC family response regulator